MPVDRDDAGIGGARVDVTATGVVTDERSLVTGGDGSATYCLTSSAAGATAVHATSSGLTADATLTWTAAPVNQPPVATAATLTTPQDTALPVTLKGTDPESDALTYAVATQPAHGTLSGSGADRTYTPAAGYHGPDSFTFTVSDATHSSAPATITINVERVTPPPVNQPPTAPHVRLHRGLVIAVAAPAVGYWALFVLFLSGPVERVLARAS